MIVRDALLRLSRSIGLVEMLVVLVETVIVGEHASRDGHMLTGGVERCSRALHAEKAAWTCSIAILVTVGGRLGRRLLMGGSLLVVDLKVSQRERFGRGLWERLWRRGIVRMCGCGI